MPEPDEGLAFRDPAKRRGLQFAVLPMTKLEVVSHQRKASDAHVKRVVDSVERVGFLAPVVVVERDGGGGYLIIDGQHRFLAARELGLRRIPAVIAPRDVARRMLTLCYYGLRDGEIRCLQAPGPASARPVKAAR